MATDEDALAAEWESMNDDGDDAKLEELDMEDDDMLERFDDDDLEDMDDIDDDEL